MEDFDLKDLQIEPYQFEPDKQNSSANWKSLLVRLFEMFNRETRDSLLLTNALETSQVFHSETKQKSAETRTSIYIDNLCTLTIHIILSMPVWYIPLLKIHTSLKAWFFKMTFIWWQMISFQFTQPIFFKTFIFW